MRYTIFIILSFLIGSFQSTSAQGIAGNTPADTISAEGVLVLPPLFEYPIAPEDLSWNERSNWLVQHFWDTFDFKQKSVGQSQLLHAFRTYIVPMHMADREVALAEIDELLNKLKKSPSLLLQFTQAAERSIYEPQTADLIIDEVYVKFLKAITSNKKVPQLRKARYAAQLQSLENTLTGSKMPSFKYTDKNGVSSVYTNEGVPTIIEFGDVDCSDCRITRLRLETDTDLQKLVNEGKAAIYFISPDIADESVSEWYTHIAGYPADWKVGRAENLEDEIDLRIVPCLYVIGADGTIIYKNANTDTAREYVKQQYKSN